MGVLLLLFVVLPAVELGLLGAPAGGGRDVLVRHLAALSVPITTRSAVVFLLKRPSTNEAMKQRRRRVNLLMASITVTFFVCWSPMVVYGFVHDFYREALPERDR